MLAIRFKSRPSTHGTNLVLEGSFADWESDVCLVRLPMAIDLILVVVVPVYQSETAPRQIRGAFVATYQLFVTMGILTSYCVNLGTSQVQDQSGSWRGAVAIDHVSLGWASRPQIFTLVCH